MPALLLALGGAFQWLVTSIMAGMASLATQKLMRFVVAGFMLPIALGWLTQHLGGSSPFDISGLLGGWLGGFPGMLLYCVVEFGIVGFLYNLLKVEVGGFVVRMLMRVFGLGS